MSDLQVQAGLRAALVVLGIAFILGAAIASSLVFLVLRNRGTASIKSPEADEAALYLVFSRLSHRLKTAGEVVRGHLRGFTDDLPDDAERWRVARRTIFEEATQISDSVERLDLVVRLGMDGQPRIMEPVNLAVTIEDLMVGLGPTADERGVLLGGVVGGIENYISGDAAALKEALSNILENAVTHGVQGTEVTAEVSSKNGAVKIRIQDTGQGMTSEQVEVLFDPGSRNYRPGSSRGTGMGLILSKMLIEMHSGTIKVSSTLEQGTTFDITLPFRRNSS
jgi:signal transduction histidine kinase